MFRECLGYKVKSCLRTSGYLDTPVSPCAVRHDLACLIHHSQLPRRIRNGQSVFLACAKGTSTNSWHMSRASPSRRLTPGTMQYRRVGVFSSSYLSSIKPVVQSSPGCVSRSSISGCMYTLSSFGWSCSSWQIKLQTIAITPALSSTLRISGILPYWVLQQM